MDEWDSLRNKIKELETSFLRPSAPGGTVAPEAPATDFWKRKYEQEREDWEKALSTKARDQALLQERYIKDEEGISALAQKIQNLERKLDSERALWEEKSRVRLLESEIESLKKDWEDKSLHLMQQNKALEQKLEKAPERAAEDERAREQLQAEKLKMEQTVKSLEAQLHEHKSANEKTIRTLETEKKALEDAILNIETERAKTKSKITQLEGESNSLRSERDLALERIESRKREQLRELEDLMKGFSHRIKNHLGIMSGMFDGAVEASESDPQRINSAGLFRENAQELAQLTKEFEEFSHVPVMEMRDIMLNMVVTRAIGRCKESIENRKVVLDKKLGTSLPKIRGDEELIVSAIEEIVANALDAMSEGQMLTVSVYAQEKERLVSVSITDQGHGIAPELAEKIFRPYFTTRKGRRGMGLPRVRRCMDLHNGSVRTSGAEGGGAVVTLDFPQAV